MSCQEATGPNMLVLFLILAKDKGVSFYGELISNDRPGITQKSVKMDPCVAISGAEKTFSHVYRRLVLKSLVCFVHGDWPRYLAGNREKKIQTLWLKYVNHVTNSSVNYQRERKHGGAVRNANSFLRKAHAWNSARHIYLESKGEESKRGRESKKGFTTYIKVRQQEKTLRLGLCITDKNKFASPPPSPGLCRVEQTGANHKPSRRPAFCLLIYAHWSGKINFGGFGTQAYK